MEERTALLTPEGLLLSAVVEGRHLYRAHALVNEDGLTGGCTCRRAFPCPHYLALLVAYQEDPGAFMDGSLIGTLLEEHPTLWQEGLEAFLRREPEASLLEILWSRVKALDRAWEVWLALQPLRPRDYASRLWEGVKAKALSSLTPSSPRYSGILARLLLWARKLKLPQGEDLWPSFLASLKGTGPIGWDPTVLEAMAQLLGYLSLEEKGLLLQLLASLQRRLSSDEARRFTALLERELAQVQLEEPSSGKDRQVLALALSRWYRLLGRHREELSVWDRHGDLPLAAEGRVRAWEAMGNWEAMAKEARLGLREAPPEKVLWFRRQWARALMAQGKAKEAWPLFLLNFEEAPSWRAYRDLKDAAQKAQRWEEIRLRAARRLAEAYWPPRGKALALKVADALAEEAPLLALRYLKAAGSAWPEKAPGLAARAESLLSWGPPAWRDYWEGGGRRAEEPEEPGEGEEKPRSP